ncbi:MAG: tetratricopeptide repeat protein, partial [Myxococcota bacterium]
MKPTIRALLLCALLLLLAPALASAQAAPSGTTPPPPASPSAAFTEALKRGNDAYNGEQYAAALTSYRSAIQLDPRQSAPYKNSARAYFYLNQYAAAQFYYDLYTVEFPDAEDRAQV